MLSKKREQKIAGYPDEIRKLQVEAERIYAQIEKCTQSKDTAQISLLRPRMAYLLSMMEDKKAEITKEKESISSEEPLLTISLEQEIAELEIQIRQIRTIREAVSTAVKAVNTSERQVMLAQITERCRRLSNEAEGRV